MYITLFIAGCLISLFAFLVIWAAMVMYARSIQQQDDFPFTQVDGSQTSPNERSGEQCKEEIEVKPK
jgi:hypothetical protein